MVCKKVEQKGTTSYNEVADELVRQILDERLNGTIDATTIDDATVTSTSNAAPSPSPQKQQHQHTKFDEKNIRRRVYDALNVLMAMNIIIKDKKAIMWRGLPTSLASASMILPDGSINMQPQPPVESFQSVQNYIQARTKNIQKKREMIQEMVLQHVSFRNLVERNYQREQQLRKETVSTTMETAAATKHQGKTPSDSTTEEQIRKKTKQQKLLDNKIPLPFIVINTNKNAVIQCNMSRDLTDVMFDFTMPFEINDDNSILKRLHLYVTNSFLGRYFWHLVPILTSNLLFFIHISILHRHQTNHQVLRKMLPDHIYQYCVANHLLDNVILTNDESIDNNVSATFKNVETISTAATKTAMATQG